MNLALIITTYNRPEYLRQCLASVKAADLSEVTTMLIVDDCSTDPETIRLINEFELPGVELIKAFSKENRSIKGSLLFGCDLLFNSCEVVTNLDGDAIVRKDFVDVLLKLKKQFFANLITGFNCLTKNKDGSERHKIISHGFIHADGARFNEKKSVGGVNLLFDKQQYEKWVRPTLVKALERNLNWDDHTCRASMAEGFSIICSVPSVVQHIGIDSAMGHSAGGEPPDVADDFIYSVTGRDRYWKKNGKLSLPEITLVSVDCVNLERVFKASDKCLEKIEFADVKIFTSLTTDEPRCENIIPIEPITSKESYSWWVMKQLAQHIKTSHLLLFQHDGYVLNASAWKDEWLEWDYIGAPWMWYPDNRVGNGGFSLRSKRLMDIVASDALLIPTTDGVNTHKEEDHCICRIYRHYLEEKYQIKFAPVEVAEEFSIEGWRSKNRTWTNEFGFHGHGLTNVKP